MSIHEQADPSSDLSSIVLSLGEEPSRNIVLLLEVGARFLECSHLNYVDTSEENEAVAGDESVTRLSVFGSPRELWLYGLCEQPDLEKIKVFTALLAQQELRLADILSQRNLKDYTKKLFEACPDGIVVCDETATIIHSNRAMVSLTQKPATVLDGLKVSQLTTKEGRAVAFAAARKLKKQSSVRFECRMNTGAGRSIPVSVCFSDFSFQDQHLMLATVRDISHFEKETQQCNTYEQSLRRSFTNATDGFVRYDQFGRITEANPCTEKLTGLCAAHMIGRPVDDLLTPASLANFRKAITELNVTGYSTFKCSVLHAKGHEQPTHASLMQFEVAGERYCRLMLQLLEDLT